MKHTARTRALSLTLAAASAMLGSVCKAQERVAGIDVSAAVAIRCKVETRGEIAFGALDPAQAVNTFAVTEARVACTRGAVYRLIVDNGRNFDGKLQRRRMTSGANAVLPYTLDVLGAEGIATGWFRPAVVRLAASVSGIDYIDLPAGQYQDVIRVLIEY